MKKVKETRSPGESPSILYSKKMPEHYSSKAEKIDFENFISEQKKWQNHNFPNAISDDCFFGVVEEVGELSHALLKQRQKIRTGENHNEQIEDAVGDIVIYLTGFCNLHGIDIVKCLSGAWSEVSARDWVKYPKNGRSE
jgi:NTP pyrophosphatase (non-canonical NTP hydrolase)